MIKLKDILTETTNTKSSKRGKLDENRPAWMAAAMIGKIIYRIIYAWAQKNPRKIQQLKDFVRKLDPTKPFKG
tara:strand:- start:118 stop:336 length:219 start_codon:yes stop_codon:yes gene_type:complete